jgi:hypothetical protein
MAFGGFFISVFVAAILGPWLRGIGIDVRAETTSVIGTALIGAFAFATGMLLRRRGSEAQLGRNAIASSETDASRLAQPSIDPPVVPRPTRERVERDR